MCYTPEVILRILMEDCRSDRRVILGASTGEYKELPPSATGLESRAFVTDRESGKRYYRLGEEFHARESLKMMSRISPDEETRARALEILQGIGR